MKCGAGCGCFGGGGVWLFTPTPRHVVPQFSPLTDGRPSVLIWKDEPAPTFFLHGAGGLPCVSRDEGKRLRPSSLASCGDMAAAVFCVRRYGRTPLADDAGILRHVDCRMLCERDFPPQTDNTGKPGLRKQLKEIRSIRMARGEQVRRGTDGRGVFKILESRSH